MEHQRLRSALSVVATASFGMTDWRMSGWTGEHMTSCFIVLKMLSAYRVFAPWTCVSWSMKLGTIRPSIHETGTREVSAIRIQRLRSEVAVTQAFQYLVGPALVRLAAEHIIVSNDLWTLVTACLGNLEAVSNTLAAIPSISIERRL
jgi:hypothetical protein